MPMPMSVLLFPLVNVHVSVFDAVVTVLVNVDFEATHRLQEGSGSQNDEHQGHDEFHPQSQPGRNLKLERDYKNTRQQKGNCMAQALKSSDQR